MSTIFRKRVPVLAALAMLSVAATAASAQTPPVPAPDTSRQGTREILNRAEAEGTRRTLGDVLGVSQAQAQTAPQTPASGPAQNGQISAPAQQRVSAPAQPQASTPAQTVPVARQVTTRTDTSQPSAAPANPAPVAASTSPRTPAVATQRAPVTRQASAPVVLGPAPANQSSAQIQTQAQPRTQSQAPTQIRGPAQPQGLAQAQGQSQAPTQRLGTPANPNMIVRVPGQNAGPANGPLSAPIGQAQPSSAPVAIAADAAAGPAPDAPVAVAQSAPGPGVVTARRFHGHASEPAWCPPPRW